MTYPIVTDEQRFWAYVDVSGDCWLWTGAHGRYGLFQLDRRCRLAHRLAYEFHYGQTIPPGLCVCHSCDNGLCVNPAHLWLGTHADNSADRDAKGRASRLFGERNPAAKLTWRDVEEIRSLRAAGIFQRVIAVKFGVSQTLISHIDRGVGWTQP